MSIPYKDFYFILFIFDSNVLIQILLKQSAQVNVSHDSRMYLPYLDY